MKNEKCLYIECFSERVTSVNKGSVFVKKFVSFKKFASLERYVFSVQIAYKIGNQSRNLQVTRLILVHVV